MLFISLHMCRVEDKCYCGFLCTCGGEDKCYLFLCTCVGERISVTYFFAHVCRGG